MLQHPFFTKHFPNAVNNLIKPGDQGEYKTFIISKDDPNHWEPFVKSNEKVKENDYLKNSKIAVSLFKNKIKIDIKGEIVPRVEVAQKAQVLEQEIIEGLKSFFGLEHTVKLKVKVNTLSKDDNPKRQRVM